jgi:DNA-binding NarL/FixJ family response regulator
MKILLADDHDLVRDTLAAFLERDADMQVVTAETLDSACEKAKNTLFDLILLDFNMPGMFGLKGLEKARECGGDRPVAIMSGTAPKSVAQDALSAGAAGFVPKTMAAKSLVNAVRFMAMGEVFVPVDFMTATEEDTPNPLAL